MKKTIVICLMAVFLVAAYSYAQMGGGMMGGTSGQPGEMMQDRDMADMKRLMNQMAGMMREISSLMRNEVNPGDIRELSSITAEMSSQMSEMSRLMGAGYMAQGDMQDLQWRMRETEDRLRMMR